MSSSCARGWTPDVFVSFAKDDEVSRAFERDLCKELEKRGIGFGDTEDAGNDAIRQVRFALILLSTEYTHSSKCMDELVKILNRREESDYPSLVVIPIFLVPAQDLQTNEEWSWALAQVVGIAGYESRAGATANIESALITTIIDRLVNEMQSLYSYKVFGPFGGEGENYWHFGEINGIKALYTMDFIESITFKVDPDTTSTEVQLGTSDGQTPFEVKLEKGEHITYLGGYFKKAYGGGSGEKIVIASLTFKTSENRTLGPINTENGEPFSVPSVAGEIIEFFGGKIGEGCLTSIGARVKLTRAELPSEDSHPVGFFGSKKGSKWADDDEHTTGRGIKVALDSTWHKWVPSIAFPNDEVNRQSSSTHEGDAQPCEEFKIGHKDEYLSSISGSFNSDGITSLTFLTNKKRTETIGVAKGTPFTTPLIGGKLVGFYGWRDATHLHGIGAYFKPTPYLNQVTSIGPFGGARAWDDGIHTGVKKIYLLIKGDNHYIRFVYDADGKECPLTHSDGVCPQNDDKEEIPLEYPDEYLTSISGYKRDDGSIQALTFYTNRRSYNCGDPRWGRYFGYPSTGTNKIVGFHGTWGKTLNSIGAYVEPIPLRPSPEKAEPTTDGSWDDGEHSHVIGYRVTASQDGKIIESITFMYDDNGSLVEGFRRGGGDPFSGKWVMLNFPEERLTSLIGYSRKEPGGTTIIHNLKLETTSRETRFSTFALREGLELIGSTSFRIPEKSHEGRRISGFFGRANACLNSIGAYLEHY